MRLRTLSLAAVLAAAATAAAAQPAVHVDVGAKLADKAHKYGDREIAYLQRDLSDSVTQALARSADPALRDATVALTLVDAKPNRPTFKEMGDRPGLSMSSFGIGGATVEGTVTTADGRSFPVSYQWYETDLRQARYNTTWGDAQTTFDRFARRLARGQEVASR